MRFATESGRPEIVMERASIDRVKSAIVNKMLNRGFRITRDTQFELTFEKTYANPVTGVLLGDEYIGQPNTGITFTIAQRGEDVRVVTDVAFIANPGSPQERRFEGTQTAQLLAKSVLEETAAEQSRSSVRAQ